MQEEVEDLDGVPVGYLQTYPLPAFVLRVQNGLAASTSIPVPPPGPLHDHHASSSYTDVADRHHKGGPVGPAESDTEGSNGSATNSLTTGALGSLPGGDATKDELLSASLRRSNQSLSLPIPPQRRSPRLPAPISAPLHNKPILIWANEQATHITGNRPLHKVVEPHTLAALQEWAQSDIVRGAESSSQPPIFSLEMGHPPVALDLVKARQPASPDSDTTIVVLTAVTLGLPNAGSSRTAAESEQSPREDLPHGVMHLPAVRAGPAPLPVKWATTGMLLPYRHRPHSVPTDSPGAQHPVTPQCHLLVDTIDWTDKKCGPPATWPLEVASVVNIAFSSFTQDCVYVGEDLNMSYSILVDHPASFGRPIREVWAPVWSYLEPQMMRAYHGEPLHQENDLVLYQRNERGRLVERYHSYDLIPIVDANKKVLGIYNPSHDTTDQVLADRRLDTSRDLVEHVSQARSQQEFFDHTAEVLERNPIDVPFNICYSVQVRSRGNGLDGLALVELQLRSTVGVPHGHPCAAEKLSFVVPKSHSSRASTSDFGERSASIGSPSCSIRDRLMENGVAHTPNGQSIPVFRSPNMASGLQSTSGPFASPNPSGGFLSPMFSASPQSQHHFPVRDTQESAWPIAKALATRQCVVVEDCSEIVKGLPIRHWDELPDMAIVVPLCPEGTAKIPRGVMIIGINLFRPFDNDYEDWIQVMRGHLASALASVVAYEEDVSRQLEKEKLERAKTAWFRGSAREFRTPLTLITAPLENLQQSEMSLTQRQSLGMVLKNVHRLQQLVTSLLDISRMEAGNVQANFVPIDLSSFVIDIAGLFRHAIARLNITFEVQVDRRPAEDGPSIICADPVLLEMLVSNLLLIVLKMTKGSVLTLTMMYGKNFAEISIIDHGGITAKQLDWASDWFSGVETMGGVDTSTDGMGIGISLVKEIVRIHNGDLDITGANEKKRGSKSAFTARIPLDSPQSGEPGLVAPRGGYARQVAEDIHSWSVDDADMATESSATAPTRLNLVDGLMFESSDLLLVVDSSRDIREYIKSVFEPFCSVIDVATLADASHVIADKSPHLVLCDEELSDGTGAELLAQMRGQVATKVTPFVMLSASPDDEARFDAFITGADDFIAKPFKTKELLLRVHLHMQTGKKHAKLEKLFAEREQEIAVLSDYCPSGIMRTDAAGWLTYANAAFREPAGITTDDNLNLWTEHCAPESLEAVESVWNDIVHGDNTTTKITWKWNTGRTMSGVFIRLDKVSPTMRGIIGCVTDITYQEEKLVEAERRRREAEESKHQQELLVDLISHEIRTPVSAILQCSSLVKDNLVSLKEQLRFTDKNGFHPSAELLSDLEEDVGALESIFQCGLVQERIAGDVLSLARIQLDMLSLHDVAMDIRREARRVMSVFSSEARMKKIDIKLLFGPTLDLLGIHAVKTDPVRLGQVITNLISNAIRFTAASDIRQITVTFNVGLEPPPADSYEYRSQPSTPLGSGDMPEDSLVYLFVSVRDTGPGMTSKEKEVLFQRFHQGNKMIHTQFGGSGLGLFICKKITDLLGGGIEVRSEVGKGSTFSFYIKARTVGPVPDDSSGRSSSTSFSVSSRGASRSNSSESAPSTIGSPDQQKPLHILIVEDNIINQTVLKRQILKAGLTCDVANNGQEALIAIHEAHRRSRMDDKKGYDVILMDLEMPVMDGLTAVRHIREAEALGTLPPQLVIALTGNAREGQINQAVEAGMDEVVIKPYRLPDLLAKMQLAAVQHGMKKVNIN